MATPKKFPIDKPGYDTAYLVKTGEPIFFPNPWPFPTTTNQNLQVAFIGRPGSGRNSLAWRMDFFNNSVLPALPSLAFREIVLRKRKAKRPDVFRNVDKVILNIRIVPPEDFHGQPFFGRRGEINESELLVFVVDLGDERSSNEIFPLLREAQQRAGRGMPPFIIVGNKVDLRMIGIGTPRGWGESAASSHSALAYLECSAKCNDRVGDVRDTILRILL